MQLDKHQKDAIYNLSETFKDHGKCLLKMFCGTGKTRTMFYFVLNNYDKIVIVLPSLLLVDQFNIDYICDEMWQEYMKDYGILNICSKDESKIEKLHDIKTTTKERLINLFLKRSKKYIICVTYQSLELFRKILNDSNNKSDICVFDEAHHLIGNKIQKTVFGTSSRSMTESSDELNSDILSDVDEDNSNDDSDIDDVDSDNDSGNDSDSENNIDDDYLDEYKIKSIEKIFNKILFLTATPKNKNGIVMYNYKNPSSVNTHCGPCAYDYSHMDAILDNVCRDIRIEIDMYTENTDNNLFKSIGRTIGNSGNNKVLTFHSYSETSHDIRSDVVSFVKKRDEIKNDIRDVLNEEFNDNNFKNIYVNGLTGSQSIKRRLRLLHMFDNGPKDNIYILSSCRTIGEGVDTKNGNAICFVDPKQSYADILQNIGRVTRNINRSNDAQPASIIIPCWVDVNKYKDCKTDDERDMIIRQEMNKNGDFNGILNVLSALKQDDPEYFESCLMYPKKYSNKEIIKSLYHQGYELRKIGNFDEIKNILNENINNINETKKYIELHTNDIDEPIKIFNKNIKKIPTRIYYNDKYDEYHLIEPKNKNNRKNKKCLIKPKKKKNININVHTNNEIKVLWNIKNVSEIGDKIQKGYLESRVINNIDRWKNILNQIKVYINKHNKRPSAGDKDIRIRRLSQWLTRQPNIYSNKKEIMGKSELYNSWIEFLDTYKIFFKSNIQLWKDMLARIQDYINKNNKKPLQCHKHLHVRRMSQWLIRQSGNYAKKAKIMKNNQICILWKNFLDKNPDHFMSNKKQWYIMLNKIKDYINKNKKRPSIKYNKKMDTWIRTQEINYIKKTNIMNNNKIYTEWEDFKNNYSAYLETKEQIWKNTLNCVKSYMDKHKKRPSHHNKKNKEIKPLGSWLGTQQTNYSKKAHIMKNDRIYAEYMLFLSRYSAYLKTNYEVWENTLNNVKSYMDKHKKKPTYYNKNQEIKTLGVWVVRQQKNYSKKVNIMKNDKIYAKYGLFLSRYSEYFK